MNISPFDPKRTIRRMRNSASFFAILALAVPQSHLTFSQAITSRRSTTVSHAPIGHLLKPFKTAI